ncbi:protein kinase family protein [Lederbergia sp. NSJ-179]|uniref:protein kinase domain-containing protein n=1 Tax=Lederbergia sp. NSJ-179 TaxID=2931402 RepID=UPI001FD56993|nr:protein kinase family protein [Lederbergia sp. NSJ-179]MCJ7843024.1 protein kinase family protein [Lederbergia sp. NSJ-179]
MMMNTWKTQCKFASGTIVTGKWHGGRYHLLKELGSGANGIVYLAKGKNGHTALKMSTDSLSITSEVNVLKAFAKVQGASPGPSLHEIDDWESPKGRIHFYAMEYIQGPDLLTFIRRNGQTWTGVMIVQLLDVLEKLHREGWAFGDLKPENLIVSGPPPRIRFIDVGGTTLNGRAVKEFTEFFDRGYWGLGSRKAEPSYDLFSTAMLFIHMYYPKKFTKGGDGGKQLIQLINAQSDLSRFGPVLQKALMGKYHSAKKMKEELLILLSEKKEKPQSYARRYSSRRRKKKSGSLTETVIVLLLTLVLYALYIYSYLL